MRFHKQIIAICLLFTLVFPTISHAQHPLVFLFKEIAHVGIMLAKEAEPAAKPLVKEFEEIPKYSDDTIALYKFPKRIEIIDNHIRDIEEAEKQKATKSENLVAKGKSATSAPNTGNDSSDD